MNKKPSITPDKVNLIENVLEERKTKRDRRHKTDPSSPHVDPKADRRTGGDRRNKD